MMNLAVPNNSCLRFQNSEMGYLFALLVLSLSMSIHYANGQYFFGQRYLPRARPRGPLTMMIVHPAFRKQILDQRTSFGMPLYAATPLAATSTGYRDFDRIGYYYTGPTPCLARPLHCRGFNGACCPLKRVNGRIQCPC